MLWFNLYGIVKMGVAKIIFIWLLSRATHKIVYMDNQSIKDFVPFRRLENETHSGVYIVFNVMRDRRHRSRSFITRTFLVQVEIHHSTSPKLEVYNNIKMVVINVPGAIFFTDRLIADVLVSKYLDFIIDENNS